MGRVVYTMGVSLDGYIQDASGDFQWAAPAEDAHRFSNEEAVEAAAFLFGRGLYEVMEPYWPTVNLEEAPEVEAEFARAYVDTPRFVFSDSLETVPDGVQLVRSADAVAEVERLKGELDGPLGLGGAGLAASLVDLIDEFGLIVNPVVVGGGKPYFPTGVAQLDLDLVETRQFSHGVVFLRYRRR